MKGLIVRLAIALLTFNVGLFTCDAWDARLEIADALNELA